MIFDLDPDPAVAWEGVVAAARALRDQPAAAAGNVQDWMPVSASFEEAVTVNVPFAALVAVVAVLRIRVLETRSHEQHLRTERAEGEMRRRYRTVAYWTRLG